MPQRVREYLATCQDKKVAGEGFKVELPCIEGLAIHLDVARSTIYVWAQEHQEFSDSVERVLAEQAKRLANNGLSGHYNSSIAKLLMAQHGYHEKTDVDHTTKGEKMDSAVRSPAVIAAEMKAAKVYEEEMKKSMLE